MNLVEQLEKYSVKALDDFVQEYKTDLDIRFVAMWQNADEAQKEMCLNKQVMATEFVKPEIKAKAEKYLKDHGEWSRMKGKK